MGWTVSILSYFIRMILTPFLYLTILLEASCLKVGMVMMVVTAWLLKEPSVPWGACSTAYHPGKVSFRVFYPTLSHVVTLAGQSAFIFSCRMEWGCLEFSLGWRKGRSREDSASCWGLAIWLQVEYGWREREATRAMWTVALEPGCDFVKYSVRFVSW